MSERPYSRLYHQLADEFPEVYDGPDLAGYVRLLVAADQAWPTCARWAGYVTEPELERLAAAGLVIPDGARYRIRGMEKERSKRSQAASIAARSRWSDADRNADRNAETMPSKAEPSKDEPSLAKPDAFTLWWDIKAGQVTEKALAFVRDLQDRFGDEPLCESMRAEFVASKHTVDREFLSRVKSRLLMEGERQAQESEKRRQERDAAAIRAEQERIANASPEEKARAEVIKAGIADFLKGAAA